MDQILCNIFLLVISIQDYKYYYVYDRYFIILFSIFLFRDPTTLCIEFILIFVILCIFYYFKMLGGADIKLYTFTYFYVGYDRFILVLLLSNLLGLLVCLLYKQKRIPFIPCIAFSMLLILILI